MDDPSVETGRHGDGLQKMENPGIHRFLEGYAAETRDRYARMAHSLIGRFGIDELGPAAEGAVNAAWIRLCEDLEEGRIDAPISRADFDRAYMVRLYRVLRDERRRQRATKRGRGRVASPVEDIPEMTDPHSGESEARIDVEDLLAYMLDRLGRRDPRLRKVLSDRMAGLTVVEIARKLGVSQATIERDLGEIRSILGPSFDEDRRSPGRANRPVLGSTPHRSVTRGIASIGFVGLWFFGKKLRGWRAFLR